MIHQHLTNQFKGWDGIILSGTFLFIILFLLATDTTVIEIKKYSVKNMEIVRPYIGENRYFKLRSKYLQIKNESDFKSFLLEIHSIAKAENIEIDEFPKD